MNWHRALAVCSLALTVSVAGCKGRDAEPSPAAASAGASAPVASGSGAPDVGQVEKVRVTTTGLGHTPAEAIDQALRQAVMQVNGMTIEQSSTQFKSVLGLAVGRDPLTLSSAGFAELVSQSSRGAISNFKVIEISEPGLTERMIKATIEANVAKYKAPADQGKLRIAIAPLRVDSRAGGDTVHIAAELRQRIMDALTQSGRFTVLERDFAPELGDEMDRISNGQTSADQFAKLGQGLGADLIWFGRVNAFEPGRRANADGEGSVPGHWSVSQKFVNVTTSEVLFSNTAKGDAGRAAGERVEAMEGAVVSKVVADILVRLYPVSVASRDGHNVVLSQGGQSVSSGTAYQVVMLGNELRDPQTGRSLGRTEQECCTVVVDRVTPSLSYGHLEDVKVKLDDIPAGSLQLRAEIPPAPPAADAKPKKKAAPRKEESLGPPKSDSNW
ncbi:CsgG/HfaB family protein [Cupriavidus basilensis]|uniref:Lipoprotein n=1 Tax=Cupriavidus basilensis TaxID=68895 RepID=A0A643G0M2_9BURK|nr:CsgG/HfaB family protein [Cupriavidus basilensis]QOT81092.1 hypothetical protein F7R26_027450 [Cupriavidus basilensis]